MTIIVLLVVVIAGLGFFVAQELQLPLPIKIPGISAGSTVTPGVPPTSTASFTPTGVPHVVGTQLVDANGHPLTLRGAQIESPFNYIKGWEQGKTPAQVMNAPTSFQVMAQQWHMNALRLPISNWIYAKYPTSYLNQLDEIVQEANSAGLYVILDLHDDIKAGSPYDQNATLPKVEDLNFWKIIAAHFKNNPMVMFDLYNEPKEPNWNVWRNGGVVIDGAHVVGFQQMVDAIRSVGAQQVIVLEPGSAGHSGENNNNPEEGGWATFPANDAINDPNVMYSLHVYQDIIQSPQAQNQKWGPLLNHVALYYGEWAFLPNVQGSTGVAHCQSLPTNGTQASQVVTNFLNYMASIHANWTAWEFAPPYMVQSYSSYAPTVFPATFTCGDSKAVVGMGSIIKQYLAS
ncbi:MAG TPA: glycoside hydrolase family 5 protein [Ktedonobacteraceae bacterium]|nr:glycoside hydrolase family 5 protein [Ktedonobacteraceae bacterium]